MMELEGNNGGDLFIFEPRDDGRVRLKIGHCCVYEIDHIVPVEFLTAILTKAVLDAGSVKKAMRSVDWPPDFLEKLVAQIKPCGYLD